ncbi:hypothetical protein ABFT23_15595 [Nocardioides sp. C4-1]|uniref:hypothetical protein n=1 Tax=Nocardioides sp. C4-1 TaxID=3151851 RepID=UPI00326357D1
MVVLYTVAGLVVLTALAVWFGNHSLRNQQGGTSSGGNALGGFDVFDPGRARMQEDLDSKETEGEMFAAPDDDEQKVRVDLKAGTIRIRKDVPPTEG